MRAARHAVPGVCVVDVVPGETTRRGLHASGASAATSPDLPANARGDEDNRGQIDARSKRGVAPARYASKGLLAAAWPVMNTAEPPSTE
jgi:hypothetical protein